MSTVPDPTDCAPFCSPHTYEFCSPECEDRHEAAKAQRTICDPLDPTYQRGFVAGANALIDLAHDIGVEGVYALAHAARKQGFIA